MAGWLVLTQLFLSNKHFVSFHLQKGRVCLGPNTEAHSLKRPLVRRCVTFDPGMFLPSAGHPSSFCVGGLPRGAAFIQTAPSVFVARSVELSTRGRKKVAEMPSVIQGLSQ